MNIPLTYGLAMAFASAIVTLVMHITGLSTEAENLFLAIIVGFPAGIAILLTGIILGTRKARATRPAGAGFSYGQAFKTGFLIVFFSGLASAAFHAIYYAFIFPDFAEVAVESTRSLLEKIGAPDSNIEEAVEQVRAKSTVSRQVLNTFLWTVVLGTIVSLITAAVMKRAPSEEPGVEPPSLR